MEEVLVVRDGCFSIFFEDKILICIMISNRLFHFIYLNPK